MDRTELDLLEAYIDNRMSENDMDRLRELLRTDAKARAYLRSLTTLDSGLRDLAFSPSELQNNRLWEESVPADNFVQLNDEKPASTKRIQGIFHRKLIVAAAALVAGIALTLAFTSLTDEKNNNYIATVVSANQVVHAEHTLRQGERLARNPIEIASGELQLRFDSGARVSLHGPARFVPIDERGGILQHGTLIGKAPEDRRGLRIVGPNFEVTDLGTEFALRVDNIQGSRLYVLEGSVALKPHGGEQLTVKRDHGYDINLQNEVAAIDREKVEQTFGKVLRARFDPLGIITPETVAFFSFAGENQEQWLEVITNTPIRRLTAEVDTEGPKEGAEYASENQSHNYVNVAAGDTRTNLNIESPLSFEVCLYLQPNVDTKSNPICPLFSNEARVKDNKVGWGVYLKRQANGSHSPTFTHYLVKDYAFPHAALPHGQWTHVVFTADENRVRLFINGDLQGESARDGKMRKDKQTEYSVAGKELKARKSKEIMGEVSYIAIHRRVLSEREIRSRIESRKTP